MSYMIKFRIVLQKIVFQSYQLSWSYDNYWRNLIQKVHCVPPSLKKNLVKKNVVGRNFFSHTLQRQCFAKCNFTGMPVASKERVHCISHYPWSVNQSRLPPNFFFLGGGCTWPKYLPLKESQLSSKLRSTKINMSVVL